MMLKKLMWIVWPAFLVAGLLEILVFAMVDPQDLHGFGGQPLEVSRLGIYTIAFFVFWVLAMVSSALTALLAMSPLEINPCPLEPGQRPQGCPRREECLGCEPGQGKA